MATESWYFPSFSALTRHILTAGFKTKAFRFTVWDRSVPSSETLLFMTSGTSAFALLKLGCYKGALATTAATARKTSLRKWIRAASTFIAIIPSFYGERKQVTAKFSFSFYTCLRACRRLLFPLLHAEKGNRRRLHAGNFYTSIIMVLRNSAQKSSLSFDIVNELEKSR